MTTETRDAKKLFKNHSSRILIESVSRLWLQNQSQIVTSRLIAAGLRNVLIYQKRYIIKKNNWRNRNSYLAIHRLYNDLRNENSQQDRYKRFDVHFVLNALGSLILHVGLLQLIPELLAWHHSANILQIENVNKFNYFFCKGSPRGADERWRVRGWEGRRAKKTLNLQIPFWDN